ncbi:hypothetical protein GO730_28795 [Spirosoma sp. HMF3257]|nr:hypothetical protein [Spirosoma telluris]
MQTNNQVTGTLDKVFTGRHDVYVVVMKRDKPNEGIIQLSSIQFNQN